MMPAPTDQFGNLASTMHTTGGNANTSGEQVRMLVACVTCTEPPYAVFASRITKINNQILDVAKDLDNTPQRQSLKDRFEEKMTVAENVTAMGGGMTCA